MATSDDGDDDISNLKSTVDLSENGTTLNQSDHNPSEVTDQVDNIGSVTVNVGNDNEDGAQQSAGSSSSSDPSVNKFIEITLIFRFHFKSRVFI